jgi:hypothetical protein
MKIHQISDHTDRTINKRKLQQGHLDPDDEDELEMTMARRDGGANSPVGNPKRKV